MTAQSNNNDNDTFYTGHSFQTKTVALVSAKSPLSAEPGGRHELGNSTLQCLLFKANSDAAEEGVGVGIDLAQSTILSVNRRVTKLLKCSWKKYNIFAKIYDCLFTSIEK